MTCILRSCAHPGGAKGPSACCSLAAAGMGECGAAFALELSKRNDGYLVIERNNPTIEALQRAGLITTKYAGDGCLICHAVPSAHAPRPVTIGYRGNRLTHDDRGRWLAPE